LQQEKEFIENTNIKKQFLYNENHIDSKYNFEHRLISFTEYRDIHKCNLTTDEDIYGGDTQAELSYNLESDSRMYFHNNRTVVINGYFEMKNRRLMEYDTMFCSLQFNVIDYLLT
jgi:hypothetical protein